MAVAHGKIKVVNRRHAALAAVVITASALSACSTNAAPAPWPDSTPSPVAAETPEWQDVTGQGIEAPRDATPYRAQFGLDPVPGIEIVHAKSQTPGDTVPCTLGPAVAQGYLTAGHCAKGYSATQYLVGSPTGDLNPLGTAESAQGPVDAAVIRTSQVTADATRIAGTWPVAGVLTAKGVRELVPVGSYVCIAGAVSGVKCGTRLADDNELVTYAIPTQEGDSGAPVFVVDTATHRAALIGIHQAGDGSTRGGAAYLDAALLATGTGVKLDPGTAVFDGQPGQFSLKFAQ